jgi:REP element-mobilizing transposase RayT
MSDVYQSLAHSKWDCKYHVVFVPKRRRKTIFGNIRQQLGPIFHALAKQKECQIVEGHLMSDHVHMCIAIPPKHPVASIIGFLKGKAPLLLLGFRERKGISPGSTSGRAVTPCPLWGSNWSRYANTSASRMPRMVMASSEVADYD